LHCELQTSRHILEDIFQKPLLGFCYPFNVYNDFARDAVRSSGYKWARGNQHLENIHPPVDPFEFHPSCHFLDQNFWNKYDRQKKRNSIFFFWGLSYELVNDAMRENFESTINRISSDTEAEWAFVKDLFV